MFRDDQENIAEEVFEIVNKVFKPLHCEMCHIEITKYEKGMGFINNGSKVIVYCPTCAEIIDPKIFNISDFKKNK